MRPSVRPITASTTSGTTCATSTSPSTTPMTMLISTIAWCTPCVERARRAHSSTLDVVSHLIWLKSCVFSQPSPYHPSRTLFDSFLFFYFYLFFPVLFRLLPPLRAVLWARQPDRHGKPVLLRQQGEWGRLRRLHLPHKFSVESPPALVAQREVLLHEAAEEIEEIVQLWVWCQFSNLSRISKEKDLNRLGIFSEERKIFNWRIP